MAEEVYSSLAAAPPADRKRLNAVLDKLDDLLDDLEVKPLVEERNAVAKSGAIYQFKVTLKESDPPIWRRIQVPDCTLSELHEVLQVVMGWKDRHLHQFVVRGESYGPSTPKTRSGTWKSMTRRRPRSARSSRWAEDPIHLRIRLRRFLAARGRPGEDAGARAEGQVSPLRRG